MSDKAASKEPMNTRSGRSVGLGLADGSEAFYLSQDAQPSTAAPLAAQTPPEEEDSASTESFLSTTATPMKNSPVSSPPPAAEGVERNICIRFAIHLSTVSTAPSSAYLIILYSFFPLLATA